MSKTFSNAGGNRDIRVIEDSDRGFVIRAVDHSGVRGIAVAFNNDTAPALALAILEAAGVAESSDAGVAAQYLRAHLTEQERITAEAEAQAKLEAEALELMNVRLRASGTTVHLTKATADPVALEGWLAVARRAREINKETPNGR